ncbi:membrane-bound PQQ-dependent dehydrogenase, glucose/quinate/shikimate family [Novosphingobium lentum]|uniref:membrane-bound PQQ-dependent dehydrogenase, glucose/quinate/shikimate family n=1 Tax=Novosphingobium lentum TaxID=145287 RepID=UPI000A9C8F94|nr:membrane-bound PQQ-dependent dehydrogenase, glucose/quinate/shikimate family [Novosphingobium lentum]
MTTVSGAPAPSDRATAPQGAARGGTLLRLLLALMLAAAGGDLCVGGLALLRLGGSPYYIAAGAALLVVALLIVLRHPAALPAYALILLATLGWALAEVGLDWWQLAPRGGVLVLFGIVLLQGPVRRRIARGDALRATSTFTALPLQTAIAAAIGIAIAAWIAAPQTTTGALPAAAHADAATSGDWPAYGGDAAGRHWSPLTQITPANIARLVPEWHYHTGDWPRPGDPLSVTYEVTPLKIDGALFLCTPHAQAIALDAETGRELWRFDPHAAISASAPFLTCRGLSYMPPARPGDTGLCAARLFLPTPDARLFALDAHSGQPCADFGKDGAVDLAIGMGGMQPGIYYSTSPPVVAGGLVVIGGQVDDNRSVHEPSGVLRAYDGRTGRLVWNWDAGRPDGTAPLPAGTTYTNNSPNSWSLSSYDPALGLIFVPLGNATPDEFGGARTATVDRLATSVVALDARTGALRWAFQTVHHDLWDMDVGSQPILVDLDMPGGKVPALVQPTKTGNIFILDRRTGKPILPVREVSVPSGTVPGDHAAPTQPVSALNLLAHSRETESGMWGLSPFDQMRCRIAFRRLRYEGPYTPPSLQGTLVYPGHLGVFNWSGIAVDPVRQVAIATPNYMAYVDRLIPRADYARATAAAGASEFGNSPNAGAPYGVNIMPFLSSLGLPCQAPPWGVIAGIDLRSGKVAWRHPNGSVRDLTPLPLPFAPGVPALGGPVATAGGVVFLSGTLDHYVRGYDVTTGRELWRSRLPAGGQATPMTYLAPHSHRQMVVVVAGGYRAIGSTPGDDVIAFALPHQGL